MILFLNMLVLNLEKSKKKMTLGYKEREILQENILNFIEKNASVKTPEIVKQFIQEGYAQRTIYIYF